MNSEQKKAIKSTILECRTILEKDIEQVLINLGIYIDEEWIDINNLTNLNEEQKKVRENIEQVIEKLSKGGFERNKAVSEYIKEVAYTYLNRIAALRVLEARGLIDEILISRPENGDKSFINSRFYEVAREYCKYNVDAGLAYVINLMFEEIGEEIKVLFSTEDEYSFITPSSNGLLLIIKLLCSNIDEESWQQDEIIGWIYQYFNDKEKDDVFDRLYSKKQKIKVEDIPAATQLFTPDWIVKWIVDNSLGTLWQEVKDGKRQGKKVEEIKLLDPCCGSGHFLVKSYDLFYQMYLEEGIYSKEEIPFKILENNIHGIDIDLRAVQLTSLILFIKTKTYLKKNRCDTNTKSKLKINIVCADAVLLNGKRLEALEEKHKNNETILKIIRIIYDEFRDVRLKGSLIQPEKKIFPLFEEFKHKIAKSELSKVKRNSKKRAKGQEAFVEEEILSLEEYKSKRDFTKEEHDLMESLNAIYSEAIKANDISRIMFASEAVKSVKLVDIFMQKDGYDVVVTNPPYLWKRNMTEKLKDFVEENYKDWSTDLYSIFISRCLEFLGEKGKLGMITQQSFMFISSYEKVRKNILNNYFIENLVHLGPRAFDDISGEKVNTVMFILENSKNIEKESNFLRLYDKQSADEKKELLLSNENKKQYEFSLNQNKFKNISGSPFVYWIDEKIFNLFQENAPISNTFEVISGMRIGANNRFLRFHWEINKNKIGNEWKLYNKGGEFSRFYGEYKYVIDWRNQALNYYAENNSHRNPSMYFKRGVTYTLVTSAGFSIRIIPNNAVFDAAGPSIFCEEDDMYYLNAFLNSTLISYLLKVLNSTINYTPTDTNKLPYIQPSVETKNKLKNIGMIGYKLSLLKFKYVETSSSCEGNLLREILLMSNDESFIDVVKKNIYINNLIKFLENELIISIDQIIFDLYKVNDKLREQIVKEINYDIYDNLNVYSKFDNLENIDTNNETMLEKLFSLLSDKNIINELIELYPISDINFTEVIKVFISYYIKRSNEKSDDGIMPLGNAIYLEEDIVENLYNNLYEDFGDTADNIIKGIEDKINKPLEIFIRDDYFKDHIKKYEKRPIYWHICSPKKTFNCFVYYHKLDEDTLYKVKSMYLSKMIERYEEDLKYYNEQLIKSRVDDDKNKEKDFKNKCSDLEEKLEDLNVLDKKIMEILPYKPDLDQGVLYNIIPLESILAARVSSDKEREEYYKEVKKK